MAGAISSGSPARPIGMDAYRMQPDQLAHQLSNVGVHVHSRVVRDPDDLETLPQAYLLARKLTATNPI